MRQSGLFGLSDQLKRLSHSGDPLETMSGVVDFELFRPALEKALAYGDGASRDENPAGPLDVVSVPQIVLGEDDEPPADEAIAVQGGRERGLVIHKLFEEVLTGETAGDLAALTHRAGELIQDIGREPGSDPANGLSADEMAGTVARTLDHPEISAIRTRLIPELPVYGLSEDDGVELATFGIVDALCIGEDWMRR